MQADSRLMYLGASGAAIKQSLICFRMVLEYAAHHDFVKADKTLKVGMHNLDRATAYIARANA